ncbi:MAG: hypothetical protein H7Z43_08480 [Clostridia bacterium]|nr:hypothetical protein [Deltaproteobacteria bacterium]
MNPRVARAAWVGLVIMIVGWALAVLGLVDQEGMPHLLPAVRTAVRFFGFCLIVTGATVGVSATIGGPTVVIVAGTGLNLAFQAGVFSFPMSGAVGAAAVLLGALWASRQIRRPPAPPNPPKADISV